MPWKKSKPRGKQKRYKRFSSAAVKPKTNSGPSLAGVFPGGRLIPETSEGLFKYRDRIRPVKDVEHFEFMCRLFNIDRASDPVRNHEQKHLDTLRKVGNSTDRVDAVTKSTLLEKLSQVEFMWTGELRRHKIHTWNMIHLDPEKRVKLFFQGTHYVLLVHGVDGLWRRSVVYTDRHAIYRDFQCQMLIWAEVFDPSSEPTLTVSPSTLRTCPRFGE